MPNHNEIQLTALDVARLERFIGEQLRQSPAASGSTAALEALLDAATIVPANSIEPCVVTMNSTVVVEERPGGRRWSVTLVYPQDADPERSRISVLSPVGRALVGARVGDVVQVRVPGNAPRELLVAELPFQPEAHGRFDL